MTDQEIEAEYLRARAEQHKKPLPYPMTEAEKRSYDYGDYKDVRSECRNKNNEPCN